MFVRVRACLCVCGGGGGGGSGFPKSPAVHTYVCTVDSFKACVCVHVRQKAGGHMQCSVVPVWKSRIWAAMHLLVIPIHN